MRNQLLCTLAACWLAAPLALAAEHPNIVVILTDDQGWGDLSLHGNQNLSTPRIDALAKEGAQLTHFYVSPVCSPTRAEMLTGRYHPRTGVFSTSAGGERLDLDERTIAQIFQSAGYATGAFGKWHNGMQHPYHPNARGFDEFYGFCSGHWGNYFNAMLEHNGEIVTGNGFMVDDLTDQAMAFIEASAAAGKPSFTYIPYNTPHSPMQVPETHWEKFADAELPSRGRSEKRENLDHTRAAMAMCENIDWNVGRLLDKLDSLNLAENTIVAYFSDNGPNGARWNNGMKGHKGSTDEGGVRAPLFMRWPGHIAQNSIIPQITSAIDLLPTFASLAGIPVTGTKPLDGVDVSPLLLGKSTEEWPERMIFSHWNGRVSVRTQRYRLDTKGNLFDMIDDPGQTQVINSDAASPLRESVVTWKREVLSELRRDEKRPFPVGGGTITQLPARDAVVSGNLKRSNRFPNCSYFTNWIAPDDAISFDVDVIAAGDYAIDIYYTCAEKNVGCEVELSSGSDSTSGKVTTANDPPPSGAEHDRVPRQESFVKAFRPMRLGTISLEKGSTTLTLRATEIPGDAAIEFRMLLLRRN
ncbi:MAG: arylsulfatase A-like enzyme [Verrucomicrobiales bacterium]|jgi:arylsulfatase A-like enzyme